MRLQHITFTGIDAKTDIRDLIEIQREYPIAEFGVLTSYHWYENGNRYLDPQFIPSLNGRGLNLALHICGSMAHDAAEGYWNKVNHHVLNNLRLFRRVQLNVSGHNDNPSRMASTPNKSTELIIQQTIDNTSLYEASEWLGDVPGLSVSMLLDASGGRGIDTPLKIWPSDGKIGYAGGFNPDNVAGKLDYLLKNVSLGTFWIDMESGVRTDDWFDIDKVRRVLATCKEVIKDLGMEV